jgi:hypothetical protein
MNITIGGITYTANSEAELEQLLQMLAWEMLMERAERDALKKTA